MRMRDTAMRAVFAAATLLITWSPVSGKPLDQNDGLYQQIAHMDTVLFDAFNNHDLDTMKGLFTKDLEFYHDKDGLSGYEQTMQSLDNLFRQITDIHRDLVKGSMEVYPVKDYGAIEVGEHTFTHTEDGKLVQGTFKFVHIWRKEDGRWKISRVISYDHR